MVLPEREAAQTLLTGSLFFAVCVVLYLPETQQRKWPRTSATSAPLRISPVERWLLAGRLFCPFVSAWQAVEEYVAATASKSDLDRTSVGKGQKKTGTDTGAVAVHPISGEKVGGVFPDYLFFLLFRPFHARVNSIFDFLRLSCNQSHHRFFGDFQAQFSSSVEKSPRVLELHFDCLQRLRVVGTRLDR